MVPPAFYSFPAARPLPVTALSRAGHTGLQELRLPEIFLKLGKRQSHIVTVGNPLVHDDPQRDTPVEHDAVPAPAGHLPHVPHGHGNAGGAKFIHMMINVVGADAG